MLMFRRAADHDEAGAPGPSSHDSDSGPGRWRLADLLILSAWCGLVSGLLEVGAIVLRKPTFDTNHLYGMSRHFVWLIPLTNLAFFLALGVLLGLAILAGGRRGSRLSARLLCALTLLPAALVALPQIYDWALLLGGPGDRGPAGPRPGAAWRRLSPAGPGQLAGRRRPGRDPGGVTPGAATGSRSGEKPSQPMPPPGSPNVLLIVLDTVAADHLGLYGYNRPTSPTIDELARRGVRFASAQATSSWTLPSHASLFTGRWPHELSAGWLTPLDEAYPTLAEFLGSKGYATAGFVANRWYCGSDSGLGRGFTVYRDYIFPQLTAFGMAVLVDKSIEWLSPAVDLLDEQLGSPVMGPTARYAAELFKANRKEAADGRSTSSSTGWPPARAPGNRSGRSSPS